MLTRALRLRAPSAAWTQAPYAVPLTGAVAAGIYALRRYLSPPALLTTAAVGLAIPIVSLSALPPLTMSTVMTTALVDMLAVHLLSLASDPALPSMTAGGYVRGLLWYALPLQTREHPPGTWLSLAADSGLSMAHAAAKLVGGVCLGEMLLTFLAEGPQLDAVKQSPVLTVVGCTLFFAMVVGGDPSNDVLRALVPLVTGGRYDVLAFNDWAFLSTSLAEFWGRRYNRLVSALLRERVFTVLRWRYQWHAEQALVAAFAVSALIHMHVAHVVFRRGVAAAGLFFLAHGLAVAAERRAQLRDRLGALGGWVWTTCFGLLTAPLYLGLFVHSGTQILRSAPPPSKAADFIRPHVRVCIAPILRLLACAGAGAAA